MCIRLTYVRLFIHSTNCRDGAFSWSIKFSVDKFFFCTDGIILCFWVYRQYTWYLKIERYGSLDVALNDFAWHHWAVVAGESDPRTLFLTTCVIWYSINKSECTVESNFDNFLGRNCCFDAICLIIFHYFTLGWKMTFLLRETTWNAFTVGSFK